MRKSGKDLVQKTKAKNRELNSEPRDNFQDLFTKSCRGNDTALLQRQGKRRWLQVSQERIIHLHEVLQRPQSFKTFLKFMTLTRCRWGKLREVKMTFPAAARKRGGGKTRSWDKARSSPPGCREATVVALSLGQGHPWPCSWKLYFGEKNSPSLHGTTCPEWLSSKTKPHGDFRPRSHVAVTARVAGKTNRVEPAAPAQTRPLDSYPDADFHSEAQLLLSRRWVSPVGPCSWVNPRTHLPSGRTPSCWKFLLWVGKVK